MYFCFSLPECYSTRCVWNRVFENWCWILGKCGTIFAFILRLHAQITRLHSNMWKKQISSTRTGFHSQVFILDVNPKDSMPTKF